MFAHEDIKSFSLERYTTEKMNKQLDDFENAATYSYTRNFVDRMYSNSSILTVPTYELCLFKYLILLI